jgi:eukaryotic-like serine/threonine-protein kinase
LKTRRRCQNDDGLKTYVFFLDVPLTSGVRFGPYEIFSLLGSGAMGVDVYRGRDPRLGRDVAIKVFPANASADPGRLQRFEQEARAAAALNHPNILAVYDVGVHDGAPYIVLELLDGETLRRRSAGRSLPAREAIDFAVQIAHGLGAAHENGIVHRDLKPDNVFITTDGRAKIFDFGLAKLVDTEVSGVIAVAGILPTAAPQPRPSLGLGTSAYMSPEQVRGVPVDGRSDIFALGAILYEMVTGQCAFARETVGETIAAIVREDIPEIHSSDSQVSRPLEQVLRRCLDKDPSKRFQSAQALALALSAVGSATTLSAGPALTPSSPSSTWRRYVAVAALALGALALGAILWWVLFA